MSNSVDSISISVYSQNTSLYAATISPYDTNQPSSSIGTADPFANLNLTSEQQQQIQQILSQNSGSSTQSRSQLFDQIEAVLTPQQQATLKTDLETQSAHHHHHHKGSPTGSSATSQVDGTYSASGTANTSSAAASVEIDA